MPFCIKLGLFADNLFSVLLICFVLKMYIFVEFDDCAHFSCKFGGFCVSSLHFNLTNATVLACVSISRTVHSSIHMIVCVYILNTSICHTRTQEWRHSFDGFTCNISRIQPPTLMFVFLLCDGLVQFSFYSSSHTHTHTHHILSAFMLFLTPEERRQQHCHRCFAPFRYHSVAVVAVLPHERASHPLSQHPPPLVCAFLLRLSPHDAPRDHDPDFDDQRRTIDDDRLYHLVVAPLDHDSDHDHDRHRDGADLC